jgi:hypothetical protein
LTSIPPGLQGITAIFRFFIDSVNKKLSDAEYLNFNPQLPLVWRAVERLAAQLAEQGKDWLPIEEAQAVIDQVLLRDGYENSLFRHLLAEGVIAENRFSIGDNQWCEGGFHLRRDSWWSIAYSEELISSTISVTLQSTDRHHGIVGQERCHNQLDS